MGLMLFLYIYIYILAQVMIKVNDKRAQESYLSVTDHKVYCGQPVSLDQTTAGEGDVRNPHYVFLAN